MKAKEAFSNSNHYHMMKKLNRELKIKERIESGMYDAFFNAIKSESLNGGYEIEIMTKDPKIHLNLMSDFAHLGYKVTNLPMKRPLMYIKFIISWKLR